jgi:uncharacterized protein (DUF433 family)/predicted HTH domain antitoxin
MDAAAARQKNKESFKMWTPLEHWQVVQLERLSSVEHDRVESALNTLWDAHPDLLRDVTVAAIEEGQVTLERGAQLLKVDLAEAERLVADYRRRALRRCCVVVCDGSVAKLADGGLPVWEVIRVYRRLGSFEKLQDAFGNLSRQTLESALAYAAANSAEIENQIAKYEHLIERRRAEYPFVL